MSHRDHSAYVQSDHPAMSEKLRHQHGVTDPGHVIDHRAVAGAGVAHGVTGIKAVHLAGVEVKGREHATLSTFWDAQDEIRAELNGLAEDLTQLYDRLGLRSMDATVSVAPEPVDDDAFDRFNAQQRAALASLRAIRDNFERLRFKLTQ